MAIVLHFLLQNIVKVDQMLLEYVLTLTALIAPTQTVWTLHWSVRAMGAKLD